MPDRGRRRQNLAFRAVHADPAVLAYLGAVDEPIARCLKRAFEQIRQQRLRLRPAWRPNQFTADACDHLISVSLTRDRQRVVIVSVVFDPEPGRP